jgi:hypothetical protein
MASKEISNFSDIFHIRSRMYIKELFWKRLQRLLSRMQLLLENFPLEPVSRVARGYVYFRTKNPNLGKFWRVEGNG